MTHLTTRLAFRALFAIVMQTEVHAAEKTEEIVVMTTTNLCYNCVVLHDQGTFVSFSGAGPQFCFRNGPEISTEEWMRNAALRLEAPKTPDNGIEIKHLDGKTIFIVGKDIRDCLAPKDCAPGHEQACQQRDHGASPYQGRGR
jgi:hypothetical protein